MKKFKQSSSHFLLLVILFCAVIITSAQAQTTGSPVTDAPDLAKAIKSLDKQSILNLINANAPKSYASYTDMITNLDPAIVKLLGLPAAVTADAQLKVTQGASSPGTAQSLSLSPTGQIDALSSFIADRFKQEMEIAYLQKLKDLLKSQKELGALLPNTSAVLQQNDPYQYTTFLETLKEALNKDINALPDNACKYLAGDPYQLAKDKPYYYPAILIYQEVLQIVYGKPVVPMLNALDSDPLIAKMPGNTFPAYFRLIAVLSRTFTNASANPVTWYPMSKLSPVLTDPDNFKSFLGLLAVKEGVALKAITLNNQTLYAELLNGKISDLQTWMSSVAQNYDALNTSYGKIRDLVNASKPVGGSQITDCSNALVALVNTLILQFPNKAVGIDPLPADIKNIQDALPAIMIDFTALVNIAAEVKDKNYGLALGNTIIAFQGYLKDKDGNPCLSPEVIAIITKYGNFAVTVVKATSTADMEQALSSAALPVGSYRIKRNAFRNFSLNAYAGIFGGYEEYPLAVPANVNPGSLTAGFTAPVGLTYSWGTTDKAGNLTGGANSFFLSAIDLGAVTSFRLTHDASATLPTLTWQNVIAPAAYYVYGFKNSPLSLGFGIQYGPQLRSITDNSAVILPSALSERVFLAIDIPVFSFYTRTEKK
jgi:hypothetical protein